MMKRFLKPKSNLTNPSQTEQDALLSPNLLSQELLNKDSLNSSQQIVITICKLFTLLILGIFFVTLTIYLLNARSFEKRLNNLNAQSQEIALYLPAEKRFSNLDKRLTLHKKVTPQRKNFVDKVSATIATIGADDDLQDFSYKDGVLTVKIVRNDILTTTLLIADLVKQENINEIAILNADLNTAENYYTVRLEITYK